MLKYKFRPHLKLLWFLGPIAGGGIGGFLSGNPGLGAALFVALLLLTLLKIYTPYATDNPKELLWGSNVALFVLFFGISVLEAVQTQNWVMVAFWFVIGLVFLLADFGRG